MFFIRAGPMQEQSRDKSFNVPRVDMICRIYTKELFVEAFVFKIKYAIVFMWNNNAMKSSGNNFAFIDSQNLNLSIKDQGWNLDFAKFLVYLKHRFGVKKVYMFIGFVDGNQKLYTFLQEAGYIIIFKPTLKLPNEKFKGNVDAELVLHSMIQYENYDKAIIVTGDGDFHCLVEYLTEQNKLKRLVIPNKKRYSSLLRRFTGHISFLNGTKKKLGK